MSSERPLTIPPPLHPTCGVQRGDIFFHTFPGGFQFWFRMRREDTGADTWESVELGYVREDGRKLTITRKSKRPSWVGGDWGVRRVSASKCTSHFFYGPALNYSVFQSNGGAKHCRVHFQVTMLQLLRIVLLSVYASYIADEVSPR